ncbi:2930_t:CDS:2, partial [Rhizophagus irregularis]
MAIGKMVIHFGNKSAKVEDVTGHSALAESNSVTPIIFTPCREKL